MITRLGGLDLSRSCLDRESRSQNFQKVSKKVSLDSLVNLDTLKKLISPIKILDLVSTSMSRPKSLDREEDLSRFTFKNLEWKIGYKVRLG